MCLPSKKRNLHGGLAIDGLCTTSARRGARLRVHFQAFMFKLNLSCHHAMPDELIKVRLSRQVLFVTDNYQFWGVTTLLASAGLFDPFSFPFPFSDSPLYDGAEGSFGDGPQEPFPTPGFPFNCRCNFGSAIYTVSGRNELRSRLPFQCHLPG